MCNKKKIIIMSAITIATCLAIITGSTFALFTSNSIFNVAITAGNLKVTATPVDANLDGNVDFAVNTEFAGKLPIGEASFDSQNNDIKIVKMVPGDYVQFAINVKNEGNIAVDCSVKFAPKTLTAADSPADMPAENINKLYNALNADVIVKIDGQETTLCSGEKLTSNFFDAASDNYSMMLEPGDSAVFKITIRFPNGDSSHDNNFINTNCGITYSVYAVQHNETATNP